MGKDVELKRGQHPNSRRNLCPPWRKGESGNPAGRPSGSYNRRHRGLRRLFFDYMTKPWEEIEAERRVREEEVAMRQHEQRSKRVQCSICRHPQVALIDGLLTLGVPVRAIAINYRAARSAIERHKQNHLACLPIAQNARLAQKAVSVFPPLIEKLKSVDEDDLVQSTWPVFKDIWEAFMSTVGDTSIAKLQTCLAKACIWLYRVQARTEYEYEANHADVGRAIQELELWRDRRITKKPVKQARQHRKDR
jgi:hypothetical protein